MAKGKNAFHELNTSSNADISCMLLIFFLLSTSMDTDQGLASGLAPPPEQNKKKDEIKLTERK